MKRNIFSLLLCLLLLAALVLPVSAAPDLPMVVDNAGLLSDAERNALEEKAQSLRTEYEMDVVILTVDSLEGKTPQDYADDYYDDNGYGYGEDYSGLLFLLSMEERDWYISTCGDTIYAITDYGVQKLGEAALSGLSAGAYYEAFDAYLNALPSYLNAFQSGRPIDGYADYSGDYYHGERDTVVHYGQKRSPNLLVPLIIGVITASVTVGIMAASMNSKRPQRSASSYLKAGSFRLRTHQDLFLYSNVSKTRRQENNGGHSGGGGSSVHHSSGGRSHGGGGGKF